MLAMSSSIFFTIRSMMAGEISALGFKGLYYLATGPVPFGLAYFIY